VLARSAPRVCTYKNVCIQQPARVLTRGPGQILQHRGLATAVPVAIWRSDKPSAASRSASVVLLIDSFFLGTPVLPAWQHVKLPSQEGPLLALVDSPYQRYPPPCQVDPGSRNQPEQVVVFPGLRLRWSLYAGISGRFPPDYSW